MNLVATLWPMIAATALTLGMVHLMVWWQNREKTERLFFALMTGSTAGMAFAEMGMMMATTPEECATAVRWLHPPTWTNFIAVSGFVLVHLKAGRLWLAWTAFGLRTISLVINFTVGPNLNFRELTGLRHMDFLGSPVVLPVGVPSPFMILGQVALLIILAFVVDATVTVWRRGERRRAVLTGGCIAFFIAMGTFHAVLSFWQILPMPTFSSPYFLGMILIAASDLTLETKRAATLEVELKDTRESRHKEVTHLGRVAAFGEISVSLAHEMNQPLGIILSNAQAAQRLLAKENPDLDEVREILGDIVTEDLRASESIQRMRALLKRGEVDRRPLDVNAVAGEVFQLMRNELSRRGVTLEPHLSPDLPMVSADRIQLQQVLLNLMLNACEAMDGNEPGKRRLHVSTTSDESVVSIDVRDAGRGLPADVESIFQPFHTTKEQGLGMGLAICRSIITAHHGQLWAERNETGGAVFHIVLPVREDDIS